LRALGHALAAVAAALALPVLAGGLLVRPRWRIGLSERLGARPPMGPGGIWVHAAGVGEIQAATRLIDRLLADGHAVCTSTVGVMGREVMRRSRPGLPCHLAPLDHPWCVDAALARVRPAVLVLVETELWPSWIAAAHRRGIPVVVASGRVSDRSFPRYRRFGRIVGPTLRRLYRVGARTAADAERFRALGASPDRVTVTGDLKLDQDEAPPQLAPDLERQLGDAPLLVAGSTHPGEERAALEALEAAERAGLSVSLVLAPRQTRRADEVVRLVRAHRRPVRRRTQPGEGPLCAGEVLVLDTVGELSALYARAEVAFVGGTLVPVGGHNVLEPAWAGRPVLFGRHTANVRHAVDLLEACGAGRRVNDAAQLASAAVELLGDPAGTRARGEEGRRALRAHRGSAERSRSLVESALADAKAA
jgi:3-deoxy-D-manno-octulosonic-acid transferase